MARAMAAWACGPALAALPALNCTLSEGGETMTATFRPTSRPYAAEAVQSNRFRLKGVIFEYGNDAVALVKIYTYYKIGRQYRPLHFERHVVPVEAGARPSPLHLGVHHLYSPGMERELVYECTVEWPDRNAP